MSDSNLPKIGVELVTVNSNEAIHLCIQSLSQNLEYLSQLICAIFQNQNSSNESFLAEIKKSLLDFHNQTRPFIVT